MTSEQENKLMYSPGNTKINIAAKPPITDMTTPMFGMNRARNRLGTNQHSVCITRLSFSRLFASVEDNFHDVTHILSIANLY